MATASLFSYRMMRPCNWLTIAILYRTLLMNLASPSSSCVITAESLWLKTTVRRNYTVESGRPGLLSFICLKALLRASLTFAGSFAGSFAAWAPSPAGCLFL